VRERRPASFTSYQAGNWANGSYSYGSLTYTGVGSENYTMTGRETWSASGSGNVNDTSSVYWSSDFRIHVCTVVFV
jgi:hypothetical protein